MNILEKIITAIRGGTRELGEVIVDSQGTRIFEQEIQEAKNSLQLAKNELTQIMAKEMQANRKLDLLRKDLAKNEALTSAALAKNENQLAMEQATKVADLETEVQSQYEVQQTYSQHIQKLKTMMEKAERQLKDYERQLTMVKTTENVQKVTATITENFNNTDSGLLSAKESLQRIKQKQQYVDDHTAAAEQLAKELSGNDLSGDVHHSSINKRENDAQAVLTRLKTQNTEQKKLN